MQQGYCAITASNGFGKRRLLQDTRKYDGRMEARTRRVTECRNGKALASSESVEDVVIASGTGSQDRFSEIRHPFTELFTMMSMLITTNFVVILAKVSIIITDYTDEQGSRLRVWAKGL